MLLDKANDMLYQALNLSSLSELQPSYITDSGLRSYSTKLSKLSSRLDGSYHVPIVKTIMSLLQIGASEVLPVGDIRLSKRVVLPGRFKRVYVNEGQGTVFIGGRQLYQLDPSDKKYLSVTHHRERLEDELLIEENMILLSRSGTVGKVTLVPEHWCGWVVNEHIIRVIPSSDALAGYLYVFLSSDYGKELIKRFVYGMTVDEITDNHVAQIPVPLLKDSKTQQHINNLALKANKLRSEAYYIEQKAIHLVNTEVLHLSIKKDSHE